MIYVYSFVLYIISFQLRFCRYGIFHFCNILDINFSTSYPSTNASGEMILSRKARNNVPCFATETCYRRSSSLPLNSSSSLLAIAGNCTCMFKSWQFLLLMADPLYGTGRRAGRQSVLDLRRHEIGCTGKEETDHFFGIYGATVACARNFLHLAYFIDVQLAHVSRQIAFV